MKERETDPHLLQKHTHHYLVVVLIQHDNYLGHVVEFRNGTKVVHCPLPLLVLLLLSHTHTNYWIECSFVAVVQGNVVLGNRSSSVVVMCLRRAGLRSGRC